MSHKIIIQVEFSDVYSTEHASEIQDKLIKALIADIPERLSFEELDKFLFFRGRQYYVRSIDFSDLNHDKKELVTKFLITG